MGYNICVLQTSCFPTYLSDTGVTDGGKPASNNVITIDGGNRIN